MVSLLPWVPVHMKPCCILQEWSLCFQTNPVGCDQPLLALKPNALATFSDVTPQTVQSLIRSSERSFLWENLCDIIIFQFVGCPPTGMGFDYIAKVPPASYLASFSLDVDFFFFGRFWSFFISYSAVSFDFGFLVRGGELKSFCLCHLVSSSLPLS